MRCCTIAYSTEIATDLLSKHGNDWAKQYWSSTHGKDDNATEEEQPEPEQPPVSPGNLDTAGDGGGTPENERRNDREPKQRKPRAKKSEPA